MKNVEVSSVCSVYLLKLRPTSLTASLTELDLELCEFTRTPGPNLSREFILFFCQWLLQANPSGIV